MEMAVKRLQTRVGHFRRQAVSMLKKESLLKLRVSFVPPVWQPFLRQTIFSLTTKLNI